MGVFAKYDAAGLVDYCISEMFYRDAGCVGCECFGHVLVPDLGFVGNTGR